MDTHRDEMALGETGALPPPPKKIFKKVYLSPNDVQEESLLRSLVTLQLEGKTDLSRSPPVPPPTHTR